MKFIHGYALLLMLICHTSCGQNQTNVPLENISKGHYSGSQLKENSAGNAAVSAAATSLVPVSMVRNESKPETETFDCFYALFLI